MKEESKTISKLKQVENMLIGSDIYSGTVNDYKLPQGKGMMQYSNGDVFEGDWFNGKKHGEGLKLMPDGSYYSGSYKMDEQFG